MFKLISVYFLITLSLSSALARTDLRIPSENLEYIGKCSWDQADELTYASGFALAEFFVDRVGGKVFVSNRIDREGGDFRTFGELSNNDLQEAGVRGLNNFKWDDGKSRVACGGRELNRVVRCTDTSNSLGSNGNVYAPCYFIEE